ncbi:MAG: hypothetical protein Q8M98_00695 [Candidatus Cloacimonadaceae bacterium]|nr:hypothetical protein [Candidatus Cloacimonadaceae bacterium]
MIPIPVEIDAMLAILNLPKEMGDNGIFKEHKGYRHGDDSVCGAA